MAGYKVLAAGDVDGALTLCEQYDGDIHLLLTDIVLPKMGGRELADKVLAIRPNLKVVYLSGYTSNAMVHHGVFDTGTAFIEKPIASNVLLATIRECL